MSWKNWPSARRRCCVDYCYTNKVDNPELNYYGFPNKDYEQQRKELWIKAVNRRESRGRPWRPSHNTSVCSLHFVNGEKSSEQYNPSFVPTIFPKGHIPSTDPGLLDWMKRVKLQPQNTCVVHPPLHRTASVGCQTDPYIDVSMNAPDMMFCWQNGVDAATQTRLNQTSSKSNEISRTDRTNANPSMLPKADQSSGSDKAMIFGFMGSQDAQSDRAMSQLAGVSLRFFRSLLTFITYADGQLAYRNVLKENRLLIFLMKMKLGISFSALGRLFGVTDRIAAMIFYQVLETLTEKTRNWIVWPSKDYVQKNMPSTFCEYRNCRCIFDCVEIRTETPPTCQQKTLLYSNSKHCYTIKFLVVTTPDGFVRKVSKAYEGRATDSFIAKDCGFLNLLEPGDLILADKRFSAIESELSKRDCTLVIPPLAVNPQYADEKSDKTHRTASVRTHLERSIQRIKVLHILDYFSSDQLPYVDAIMHMCCVIVNSLPSLSDGK